MSWSVREGARTGASFVDVREGPESRGDGGEGLEESAGGEHDASSVDESFAWHWEEMYAHEKKVGQSRSASAEVQRSPTSGSSDHSTSSRIFAKQFFYKLNHSLATRHQSKPVFQSESQPWYALRPPQSPR